MEVDDSEIVKFMDDHMKAMLEHLVTVRRLADRKDPDAMQRLSVMELAYSTHENIRLQLELHGHDSPEFRDAVMEQKTHEALFQEAFERSRQ